MSVSGNLRIELGDYLSFSPSMLPKNFWNNSVKNSIEVRFILKPKNKDAKDLQKEEVNTPDIEDKEESLNSEITPEDKTDTENETITEDKEELSSESDTDDTTAEVEEDIANQENEINKPEKMSQEEILKMFKLAQEASVERLSQQMEAENFSENSFAQNPFLQK